MRRSQSDLMERGIIRVEQTPALQQRAHSLQVLLFEFCQRIQGLLLFGGGVVTSFNFFFTSILIY